MPCWTVALYLSGAPSKDDGNGSENTDHKLIWIPVIKNKTQTAVINIESFRILF